MLPALGEGGVEQRPIGSLIAKPHGEVDETRELATLKGSARIAVVMERLLWGRLSLEGATIPFGRRREIVGHARGPAGAGRRGARAHAQLRGRAASASASGSPGMVASRLLDPDSLAGQDEALTAVRKTKEYQQLVDRAWPQETPEGLVEKLFKNRSG